MTSPSASERVTIFGHEITMRWQGPPSAETPWRASMRQLLEPWAGDSSGRAVRTSPCDVTTITLQPHPTRLRAFLVTAHPSPGANQREPAEARDEYALVREVERLAFEVAIARSSYPLIAHAGAVSRDGAALLFPATSAAGKTTLTYSLALRGWLPLTDDICPLREEDGAFTVVGCSRAGHLDLGTEHLLREAGIQLEGPVAGLDGYFRPARWGESAPVRAIITPRYQADANLTIEALTMAEGAGALYSATFQRERVSHHDEWLAALRLGRQVPSYRVTYGSLDSALAGIDTISTALGLGRRD